MDCAKDGLVVKVGFLEDVGVCASPVIHRQVEALRCVETSECCILVEQGMCAHWCLRAEFGEFQRDISHCVEVPILLSCIHIFCKLSVQTEMCAIRLRSLRCCPPPVQVTDTETSFSAAILFLTLSNLALISTAKSFFSASAVGSLLRVKAILALQSFISDVNSSCSRLS